jgi:hypothetical protein
MSTDARSNPIHNDRDSIDQKLEIRPSSFRETRQPSVAYLNSKRKSELQNKELESKGVGVLDYEYRDPLDETESHIEINFKDTTKVTVYQKIRKIGRKTTCMAFCLLFFGIAMIITSFFYVRQITANGFYLFLMIGVCALIPGSYASYWVTGKFFGWSVNNPFIVLFIIHYASIVYFLSCLQEGI